MKEYHKPLARHRFVSFLTCAFLAIAFLLFLLVSISLTIIKPIYLLAFRSTAPVNQPLSIATELRFGIWGVCASSNLVQPTLTNAGECFGPKLGYDVPDYIANAIGLSPTLVAVVQKALLVVLVLHPIVAGLTLLNFIAALFLGSHIVAIFVLVFTILTSLVATLALGVDLGLVLAAKAELAKLQNVQFEIVFGNGVWMIVTAVVLCWLAVIALSARSCYCLGVRRSVSHSLPCSVSSGSLNSCV
ncbi:hypothetical protein M413DRAFT_177783 [Hebeloma cylindrosporum]|uniref:Pali-domain-containing protein n=1 Tax=Hebeloma cylindrosporum TaxID=76867 RepID=A0A0C3C9T5_HEBCY|nr:hypothetical protein M413DRAFT_177783 [Hebeloma cylindrosporum h7]